MISAADARKIAKNSESKLLELIEQIGNIIEKVAARGDNLVIVDDELYMPELRVDSVSDYIFPTLTDQQKALKKILENKYGYVVSIISRQNSRLGFGLIEEDELKPIPNSYHIKITW